MWPASRFMFDLRHYQHRAFLYTGSTSETAALDVARAVGCPDDFGAH